MDEILAVLIGAVAGVVCALPCSAVICMILVARRFESQVDEAPL